MSPPTVAVLGTGTMGAPIARNLARAGMRVVVWNRTLAKATPLEADGVEVAASAANAVAAADLLVTMLADGPAIEDVLEGAGGALAAAPEGSLWVQMSTVGPASASRLEALARGRGIAFVDAPVLGSQEPAVRGELIILASGPDTEHPRCAPLFDAIGSRTHWLGPAGAGSRLKVVVNAWLMAMTAALGETFALASTLDIDPEHFFEVTDGGEIAALYTDLNGKAMAAREFPVNFPLALATKDTTLALEAAGGAVDLRVFEATRRQFARAEELGFGGSDWAAVIHAALGTDGDAPASREHGGPG